MEKSIPFFCVVDDVLAFLGIGWLHPIYFSEKYLEDLVPYAPVEAFGVDFDDFAVWSWIFVIANRLSEIARRT
jgi:hypothetical protein